MIIFTYGRQHILPNERDGAMERVAVLPGQGPHIDLATVIEHAFGARLVRVLIGAVPQNIGVFRREHPPAPAVVHLHIHLLHTLVGRNGLIHIVDSIPVGREDIGQTIIQTIVNIHAHRIGQCRNIPVGVRHLHGETTDHGFHAIQLILTRIGPTHIAMGKGIHAYKRALHGGFVIDIVPIGIVRRRVGGECPTVGHHIAVGGNRQHRQFGRLVVEGRGADALRAVVERAYGIGNPVVAARTHIIAVFFTIDQVSVCVGSGERSAYGVPHLSVLVQPIDHILHIGPGLPHRPGELQPPVGRHNAQKYGGGRVGGLDQRIRIEELHAVGIGFVTGVQVVVEILHRIEGGRDGRGIQQKGVNAISVKAIEVVVVGRREGCGVNLRRRDPAHLEGSVGAVGRNHIGVDDERGIRDDVHADLIGDIAFGAIGEAGHHAVAVVVGVVEGRRGAVVHEGGSVPRVGVPDQVVALAGGHAGFAMLRLKGVAAVATIDVVAHRVGAGVGRPGQAHAIAHGLGLQVIGRRGHHAHVQGLERHQRHLRSVVLRLEQQRVGRDSDVPAIGVPHQIGGIGRAVGDGHELHGRVFEQQQLTGGRKRDKGRCGVDHRDGQHQARARQHARVVHQNLRRLVVARRNGNLHVAHHTAHHHPVAPLLDQDGDVVLAGHGGRIPNQVAGHRINGDAIGGIGQRVAGDILAVVAPTADETVRQAVAVGIVCAGVVVVDDIGTSVVDGLRHELRRRVAANEGVDNHDGFNEEGHLHGAGDVDDSRVTVGVLEGDMERAGGGEGVPGDIDILADVVVEVDFLQPADDGGGAVAPADLDFGPVGGAGGIGIGDDGELVGQAGHVGIADLTCALVGGKEGHREQQEQHNRKQA